MVDHVCGLPVRRLGGGTALPQVQRRCTPEAQHRAAAFLLSRVPAALCTRGRLLCVTVNCVLATAGVAHRGTIVCTACQALCPKLRSAFRLLTTRVGQPGAPAVRRYARQA